MGQYIDRCITDTVQLHKHTHNIIDELLTAMICISMIGLVEIITGSVVVVVSIKIAKSQKVDA